jgi:uncharacterized protein (TIGR00288 family)
MSPWWLRPTSDEQSEETPKPEAPAAEAAAPDAAAPGAAPPLPASSIPAIEEDRPLTPWSAAAGLPADLVEEEEFPDEEDEDEDESAAEASRPEGAERPPGAPARRRRRGGRRRGKAAQGNGEAAEETPPRAVVAAPAPRPAPAPRARRAERSERAERPEVAELPPVDLERLSREIYMPAPERPAQVEERKIALFCDLENIALGVRDSEVKKFDIDLVLERLLEKGKIIVKKAYCDWERYSDYKRTFHEAAIELIDIPQKYYSGKNSADIKMVVDAMDLSYSKEHLDTFVILSGDSDFSPLVSKLKENNKYVIGVGVKNSSSNLLIDNCDEFLYYEDLWREQKAPQTQQVTEGLSKKQAEAFSLMIDSIQALMRENKDVLWGSMIKQTMQRKKPSFNEGYFGYSTFSELLEDAERKGIIKLKKDQRSGSYIVTGAAPRR